jgi:hypothetical protein
MAEHVVAAEAQFGFAILRKARANFRELLDQLVERNMVRDIDELLNASTHS